MKKFCEKLIIIFILTFGILSCGTKKNATTNNNFIYENGKEKITFEIISKKNYLIENKNNFVKVTSENINPPNLSIAGKTIRAVKGDNLKKNEMLLKISPTENDLENGNLILFVSYKSENEFNSFKIQLPVKKEN